MAFPAASPGRFRSLLWKIPVEREIDSELAFHLEMRTRDYVARGMTPEAARAAALARLGDLGRVRRECRRIGRLRDRAFARAESFAELRQDLKLAFHRHMTSPVFSTLAIATLALALAAATVAFAALDALVLRPLAFPEPDRLVRLREVDAHGNDLAVSRLDYLDWRRSGQGIAALAALLPARRGLSLPGAGGERAAGVEATASLFPLLGVRAARGRLLSAADESRGRPHDVAVLSDRLWRRLGADPDLVGKPLVLDGRRVTVVGVLPREGAFPPGADLWLPLVLDVGPARQPSRDRHELAVIGRLAPRIGEAAAGRLLARIASPGASGGVRVTPLSGWVVGPEPRSRVLLAFAAALLLALLASSAVANLLLSRAEGRGRELALRAALGAGRGRILCQLATEGALLALLGAALSLPLADTALSLVRGRFAAVFGGAGWTGTVGGAGFATARLAGLAWDGRAAGFFAIVALAAALAVGLGPALGASRVDLRGAALSAPLRSAGRARRLRDALVVGEIAFATLLLVAAGLTARSYLRLAAADPGFRASHLLAVELALQGERYPAGVRRELSRTLEARLARLPGVLAVGSTSYAPWKGTPPDSPFVVKASALPPRPAIAADWQSVSPGFFPAMGVPLLAGRPAAGTEREVVVDRTLARRAWPRGDALGRPLDLGDPAGPYRVVGVAREIAAVSAVAAVAAARPTVYLPYSRRPWRTLSLVLRTAGDPARESAAVRREIVALAPDLPAALVAVRSLREVRETSLAAPRASLLLLAFFALLALALGAIGVYDLLTAGVGERTPEIAVRMALGASPRRVLLLILTRGLLLAGSGLALGLLAAARLARFLPAVLYATSPTDPLSYLGTALLLIALALAAGILPALRATRIAPAAALACS